MIYSALSLKINAKITILFHINDFFVFIFQKSEKKFGRSKLKSYLCCNKFYNITMAKYNIQPKKEKIARYQSMLSEETKDRLRDEIIRVLVTERKYKDPDYSSKKLAEDLNTNSRYISAVCATRFHKNYAELVNDYRVNDAMSLLTDKRYARMSVEGISEMAGFNTRQSFYANFFKRIGVTPRQYRANHFKGLE